MLLFEAFFESVVLPSGFPLIPSMWTQRDKKTEHNMVEKTTVIPTIKAAIEE